MAEFVDYYEEFTAETKLKHQKMAPYIELAEQQGDAITMDGMKPWELKIIIRKQYKEKKSGAGV